MNRSMGMLVAQLTAFSGVAAASGCTSNPYVIGALSMSEDGGTQTDAPNQGLSFVADFDRSGGSFLGDSLALPSGTLGAALRLRGELAAIDGWPADSGPILVRGGGMPQLDLEAPFTDSTRAVGVAQDAPIYVAASADVGSVDSDDLVLELVLRTEPGALVVDKRAAGVGWSVSTTMAGALSLDLADGGLHQVVSEPLIPRAWYHCLFWVSRSIGGQAFCNARAGTKIDLASPGSLTTTTPLAIGGVSATAGTELAELALFRASSGRLDGADWSSVSRERFAELTGARPSVARGSALPKAGMRDSPAYLDLQRQASSARRLFLVGPDWPRIACRTDTAGTRDCGYLSEPKRTRLADPDAGAWNAVELTVLPDPAVFADGDSSMSALIASTTRAPHRLGWSGTYGPSRQALSFFVRPASGGLLSASVTNVGTAVFDLRAGVVASAPGGAQASLEAWGGGLFRCALAFAAGAGVLTYQIELLGDPSGSPFAGDGTSPWVRVAGLQLDVGQAYAGSLIASAAQAADELTFVADDGNLPAQDAVSIGLRLLLPSGPRLTDQAVINLNRGAAFADQIQLFVRGNEAPSDTGKIQFWGLRDGMTHWTFFHPTSAVDGALHAVQAQWSVTTAEMRVDGLPAVQPAILPNAPPFALDRIDVGFSTKSSGALEGLLAGLSIGQP